MFSSGAMTASSMSSSATSARRSVCRPSAWMPSSFVSRTRSIGLRGYEIRTCGQVAAAATRIDSAVMGRRGIALILAAAAACLVVAAVGAYSLYAVFDQDAFADRALSTLHSDEVRQEAATRLATHIIEKDPRLTRAEEAINEASSAEVENDPTFAAGFRTAALDLHASLFSSDDGAATLRVAGTGGAIGQRAQDLEHWPSLPAIQDPALLSIETSGFEGALQAIAPRARAVALPVTIVFALAGLALLALGIARAPTRRRGVWAAGITVAAAAGLLAAGVTGACDFLLSEFDTGFGDAVVSQVWGAFLGDLRSWALAAAGAGLVAAAAAGGPRLSPRALLSTPTWGGDRLVRAGGLLAIAVLAVTLPKLVLDVALVALAGALVYVAAGELVRVVAPPDCPRRVGRAVVTAGAL